MTLQSSVSLQKAVYDLLIATPSITNAVGTAIFDAPISTVDNSTYITLGEEEVRQRTAQSTRLNTHRFNVSIVSDANGFKEAKEIASHITDALLNTVLVLEVGSLVDLTFDRSRAYKTKENQERKIDLWFNALIEI